MSGFKGAPLCPVQDPSQTQERPKPDPTRPSHHLPSACPMRDAKSCQCKSEGNCPLPGMCKPMTQAEGKKEGQGGDFEVITGSPGVIPGLRSPALEVSRVKLMKSPGFPSGIQFIYK